jgi:hypothetical protein
MTVKKNVNIIDDMPSYTGTPGELCKYNNTPFLVQADGATLGGHVVGAIIAETVIENVYATNRLTWDSVPEAAESDTNLYEIITERSDGILIIGSSAELSSKPTADLSIYETMTFPLADERTPNTRATPGDMLWRYQQLHFYTYDGWFVLALL